MDAHEKITRVMSLLHHLLRLRQRYHLLRRRNRLLEERHARLFQRRLDQLKQEISAQIEREGFSKFLEGYLADVERGAIELALEHSDGNVLEASVLLGTPPDKLRALMHRYGLRGEDASETP